MANNVLKTLALWALAAAAAAQSPEAPGPRLLTEPGATAWNAWGAGETHTFRADEAVRGQTAFRVSVATPGTHPWDAGAAVVSGQDAQKGDTVIAAFWARSADPGGAHVDAMIQAAHAPYTPAAQAAFDLSPQWRLYQLRGALPFAAAAGELELTAQLAGKAQTVEFGPAYLLDAAGGPAPSPDAVARLAQRLPVAGAAEDVTIDNAAAKVQLAATLRKPAGQGPYPIAIFFQGGGPLQRVGDTALTRALLGRGIATLSFDKRGVGASTGDFASASLFDHVDDAVAAVAYAKRRPDIDPSRITLIGGSYGSIVAPAVALREPVAFLVLRVAPAQSLARAYLTQQAQQPQPPVGSAEARRAALIKAAMTILAEAHDPAEVCERGKAFLNQPEIKAQMSAAEFSEAENKTCDPAFLRTYLYDPAPTLRKIRIPTLVVSGSLDLQVPPDQNLPIIREAMADNPDLTVIEFPGLNHLLRYAKTGSVEEWRAPDAPTDDAQEAVDVIADWTARHAFGAGARSAQGR